MPYVLPFYTILGMHRLSVWLSHRLPHINVSKSNFWIGQSLFSILQSLTHLLNLSIWMLVGAISISSFFSFWKLDYFSDMDCLKNPLAVMISCSSSTQLITSNFSVMLESNIDTGYIHWRLTPFQSEKLQLKLSQYLRYIIWESHCTKMIVGRLLKLTLS